MSRNAWIIFSVVVVGLLGFLVYISSQNSSSADVSEVNEFAVLEASEDSGNIGDHVQGNADSEVVLIEYVDFQCPSCASVYPQVQSIVATYGEHIAIVSRSFAFLQPHGMAASSAAEAAGLQGKYDQMVGVLFSNQSSWSSLSAADRDQRFLEYARDLGLDTDKFQEDRASSEVRKKINFDKSLGSKSGVSGTPSFFLNGERIDTTTLSNDQAIRDLIDAAIKDKGGTPPEPADSND